MSLSPTGILPTGDTGKVHQCLKFIFPICSSHSLFTKLFIDSLNSFRQIFCVEYRTLSNSQLSLSKIRGFNSGVKIISFICFSKKAPVVKACLSFGTPCSGAQTHFSVLTLECVPEEHRAPRRGPVLARLSVASALAAFASPYHSCICLLLSLVRMTGREKGAARLPAHVSAGGRHRGLAAIS